MNVSITRDNHYVPEWYQRGFLADGASKLHYLDLTPDSKTLPGGRVVTFHSHRYKAVSQCFFQTDLYTTFFGRYINDDIERLLFGAIDDTGSRAVRAFSEGGEPNYQKHFINFFSYIDTQKLRTPKGLDWIRANYPRLGQIDLMREMQALRNMNCTIWAEGVREIVSAENADVKFIISDHPVTTYNYALPPNSQNCRYPKEPAITMKATQTIFPLSKNYCLILTNYEYANSPQNAKPLENRTNANLFRSSIVNTVAMVRSRELNNYEVANINLVIKLRARRYIGASEKELLHPENAIKPNWGNAQKILLPPKGDLIGFGGEMYIGYEDGSSSFQDAFGRTKPEIKYLKKQTNGKKLGANSPCSCGSGKKYKKCCRDKPASQRPLSTELSIRERNLAFINGVLNVLGLSEGKVWEDVRRDLNDEQVEKIHEIYGFLWPVDTNIIDLLPKPDNSLRALYTGLIDPRVISRFGTSLCLYFDKVIIQSPFINHACVKPEMSPVKSPRQFREQTLVNVALLLELAPFIDAGYINFVPDPCDFNWHLREQMLAMAEARSGLIDIDEGDRSLFEFIQKENFERTLCSLSEKQQVSQIRQAIPDITDDQLQAFMKYIAHKKASDQLILLQDGLYEGKTGQLTMMSLLPNFEMTLLLAQMTGSFILTDSQYRWDEISASHHKDGGFSVYPWQELTTFIGAQDYPCSAHPEWTFNKRSEGKLGQMRKGFREAYHIIQRDPPQKAIDALSQRLMALLQNAQDNAEREFGLHKQPDPSFRQDKPPNSFAFKMNVALPKGGIVNNNVQRLLLATGSSGHLGSTPMAILVEPNI